MRFVLFMTLLLSGPAFGAIEVKGRVFYPELDRAKPSFSFESQVTEKDGKVHVATTYRDVAGKPIILENVDYQGDRLLHYEYKQEQVKEYGDASFEGGEIRMSFTEESGKKSDTEHLDPSTIVAPMINPLIVKNWDRLMAGDSVKVRYLAIERLETIGFKFFKDREHVLNGKPVVDILMKPSSFFISALVSPIRLTVMKDAPHWILESEGRTPIRVPKRHPPTRRKDWRAIDARTEYDVPKP